MYQLVGKWSNGHGINVKGNQRPHRSSVGSRNDETEWEKTIRRTIKTHEGKKAHDH